MGWTCPPLYGKKIGYYEKKISKLNKKIANLEADKKVYEELIEKSKSTPQTAKN